MYQPVDKPVQIGVIGGSGLYEIDGLADIQELTIETPFGATSDDLLVGSLDGVRVAFLPRHGKGHRISPSELPVRANIWALKSLGVKSLLSFSAVGSLREGLIPRDFVIPDQILDRTKGIRPASFFGDGIVAHVAFGEPYCSHVSKIAAEAARQVGVTVHETGTMVVMEGPQFSTKAESLFYRQIGGDVIGMTALPEAKLAREAEICYATVAMVTDYDCWHEEEEAVTVDMVVANVNANVANAREIIRLAVPKLTQDIDTDCACRHALEGAIMTAPDRYPENKRRQLALFLDK